MESMRTAPTYSKRMLPPPTWSSTFTAFAISAVASLAVNTLIALVARGLFTVPPAFTPLTARAYGPLTVIGVLAGALSWRLVVRRARHPAVTLRRLVPAVVLLSFIPDAQLLLAGPEPRSTPGTLALMTMHLAIAAIAVPTFQRLMPAIARGCDGP